QAEAALGMKIRHFVPEDAQVVTASVNCGVPIVTEAPRSLFAKSIASIAESLAPACAQPDKEKRSVEEPVVGADLLGSVRTFLKMSIRECTLRASHLSG